MAIMPMQDGGSWFFEQAVIRQKLSDRPLRVAVELILKRLERLTKRLEPFQPLS